MRKEEALEERAQGNPTLLLQIYRRRAALRASAPPSDASVALCVRAWNELEGTRPVWGSNLGPIPYDAVERWSAVNGLDEEMFALLLHALSVADGDRSRRIEAKAAMDAATGGNRR